MVTPHAMRIAFTALVLVVGVQRLWELRRSRAHEAALRARGAIEHAPEQMPWMRALHGVWLFGMLFEAWALDRTAPPALALAALTLLVVGQALRLAAMRALGERWNVKILTLDRAPAIETGVFAHVRHPNYLGVVLEVAALPLIGGAWITALAASIANGALLAVRIRAEERALASVGTYDAMRARPRLVPKLPARRS